MKKRNDWLNLQPSRRNLRVPLAHANNRVRYRAL